MAFSLIVRGQHRLVRGRTRVGGDIDALEVAQIGQPGLGSADRLGAVRVAFGQAELAPDHLVLGAGVADDVDALDVDARSLADVEDQVDGVLLRRRG